MLNVDARLAKDDKVGRDDQGGHWLVSQGDQVVEIHDRWIYKDQPLVGEKKEKTLGLLIYVG